MAQIKVWPCQYIGLAAAVKCVKLMLSVYQMWHDYIPGDGQCVKLNNIETRLTIAHNSCRR